MDLGGNPNPPIKPEPKLDKETVRYTLEEEFATELKTLRDMSEVETKKDENLNFELKVKKNDVIENKVEDAIQDNDVSPMNRTIAELRDRAEIRRERMRDFNYKFVNKFNQNIDDIESQPAYKRMGVNLDEVPTSSEADKNTSRMTLGTDDNDDIQLRSNNSFLHDNVD